MVGFGYKVSDNSFFGSSQIVFGFVGATIAGRILDRKRKFKRQLTITTIGTLVGVGVVGTVVYSKLVWALSIALAFLGFFVLPMLPVSYQFGVELLFPVGEAFTVGLF